MARLLARCAVGQMGQQYQQRSEVMATTESLLIKMEKWGQERIKTRLHELNIRKAGLKGEIEAIDDLSEYLNSLLIANEETTDEPA